MSNNIASLQTLANWYSQGLHVAMDCPTARNYYLETAKLVEAEIKGRKRKYRSVVPPDSMANPKKRSEALSLLPSRDLIEYYKYSADKGSIESLVFPCRLSLIDHIRAGALPWRS